MNKNAEAWIKALRSGKYKQTKGALRKKDGFCCLGVACDLYAKSHKSAKWSVNKTGEQGDFQIQNEAVSLPWRITRWLGLDSDTGVFNTRVGTEKSLSALNDDENYSFKEIAEVIEKQPQGLFKQ